MLTLKMFENFAFAMMCSAPQEPCGHDV